MKNTYNINLGSRVFYIDEDAMNALQTYIKTLETFYLQEEDGKEIMADIENRIAELFTEYLKEPYKQVINIRDINRVIQIMGTPNDIIDEDIDNGERKKQPRTLYRDPDHRILGGVASGIAAYFSIPVILVRLCFIFLTFMYGTSIIAYIVLWIIIPPAKTAKERLEMRGEGINVSNIEKNIRDKYNEINNKKGIQAFFDGIKHVFKQLFHIIEMIIKAVLSVASVFILVGGIFLLCAIGWFLFFPCSLPTGCDYGGIAYLINDQMIIWSKIAFALTTILPILLLIYLAVKHLFHLKKRNHIPLYITGLWFLGILLSGVCIASCAFQFSNEYKEEVSYPIELSRSDRKYIVIKTNNKYPVEEELKIFNVVYLDNQNKLTERTDLRIEKAIDSSIRLEIQKKARGNTKEKAYQNIQSIDFNWELKNDTLTLDRSFMIGNAKWRSQQVLVRLFIPDGYGIIFKNHSRRTHESYEYWAYRRWEYNKLYMMHDKGLE